MISSAWPLELSSRLEPVLTNHVVDHGLREAFPSVGRWLDRTFNLPARKALTLASKSKDEPVTGPSPRPMTINGQRVARVEVTSNGEATGTKVVYVTESGRRIAPPRP